MNFISTSIISLTEKEEQIFNIITECIKWKNRKTIARVAGGWVRDKILGRFSDDIDIALDDQNGEEFAESINEYLLFKGYPVLSISIIQANPDQSKHLQTATFRIFDQSIDCVNLRSESYADESRIPEIKCGTALEDALRRDFTINSLFYNLSTKTVEDLTNRGISDLHTGIIRTPVEPLVTFKDDPLRLLRAIRFASRFQFEVNDDIIQVSKEEIIKQALLTKVSRARILKECEGMIGKHANDNCRPALAISLMMRLKLFDLIFLLPPLESIYIIGNQMIGNHDDLTKPNEVQINTVNSLLTNWQQESMSTVCWVNLLLSMNQLKFDSKDISDMNVTCSKMDYNDELMNNSIINISKELLLTVKGSFGDERLLFWSAAVIGLRKLQMLEKKKMIPLFNFVLVQNLKIPNETMKSIQILIDFCDLTRKVSCMEEFDRVNVGLLLRSCKELWNSLLLFSCAVELSTITYKNINCPGYIPFSENGPLFEDAIISLEAIETIKRYLKLQSYIEFENLNEIWLMTPLLDGNEIMKVLDIKGPTIRLITEEQFKYQLQYPQATLISCIEHLRVYKESL